MEILCMKWILRDNVPATGHARLDAGRELADFLSTTDVTAA